MELLLRPSLKRSPRFKRGSLMGAFGSIPPRTRQALGSSPRQSKPQRWWHDRVLCGLSSESTFRDCPYDEGCHCRVMHCGDNLRHWLRGCSTDLLTIVFQIWEETHVLRDHRSKPIPDITLIAGRCRF